MTYLFVCDYSGILAVGKGNFLTTPSGKAGHPATIGGEFILIY
jgi:hypothetical protein